jgi:hypothetical protein
MKVRRIFRANRKTAEVRAREHKLRDKLQKEKPSLADLVRSGACDPDAVMTMGMYFDVQQALQALKRERQRRGLSIGAVENGKQDNPTVATLMRYAAAIGKRFLWSYEALPARVTNGDGRAGRKRGRG